MTVREMIEALQELHMPDALVVRGDNRDNPPRIYYERGPNWDVVQISQFHGLRSSDQWFARRGHDEINEITKWAVVI